MKVYVGRYVTEEDTAAALDDGGFEDHSLINWGLFFGTSKEEVLQKMKDDMKSDLEDGYMDEGCKVLSVVANMEEGHMIANCLDEEGDGYKVEAKFTIAEEDLG